MYLESGYKKGLTFGGPLHGGWIRGRLFQDQLSGSTVRYGRGLPVASGGFADLYRACFVTGPKRSVPECRRPASQGTGLQRRVPARSWEEEAADLNIDRVLSARS